MARGENPLCTITLTILDNSAHPQRGDRLLSPRTLYWVLHAKRVRRKRSDAEPQYRLLCVRSQHMEEPLKGKLLHSAFRRGGSVLYSFEWNSRNRR